MINHQSLADAVEYGFKNIQIFTLLIIVLKNPCGAIQKIKNVMMLNRRKAFHYCGRYVEAIVHVSYTCLCTDKMNP